MKKGTRIKNSEMLLFFFFFFFVFCLFRDAGSQILIFNWEVGELWHRTILFDKK